MLLFRTLNGSFAVLRTCTLLLITTLATVFQSSILWPLYTEASTTSVTGWHVVTFDLAVFYLYWTFLLSCQDPGAVSPRYVPKDDAHPRYCTKCKNFKPPRTHHCKSCKRCVLRMDHHCPWLSSCVGHGNHAAFIKFLLIVVPTTGYLAMISGHQVYRLLTDFKYTAEAAEILVSIFLCITASSLCLMVFCLLVYQVWCAIENITTIESWSKKCTEDMIRKKKIPPIEFPYDLYSTMANLREMFGHGSILFWCWPPVKHAGSGHKFPVNENADTTRSWPPRVPDLPAASSLDASSTAIDGHDAELYQAGSSPTIRARSITRTNSDSELLWHDEIEDDYLTEDSDGDYVDGDGEYLDSYGVDDDDEVTELSHAVSGTLTMAQLLAQKRAQGE